MPSSARKRSSTGIYHVMARGVSKSIIFEDDDDRRMLLRLLSTECSAQAVRILAWCLMDNHYHILLEGDLPKISTMMKRVNSIYAMVFNERHGRVGHLFQGRFKSVPVETDEQLLTEVRYIHQNPVKDGLSSSCDYRWSSYNGYFDNPWLVDNALVCSMFTDEEEFARFHEQLDLFSPCLDQGRRRSLFDSEEILYVARSALGDIKVEEVVSLPRKARDEALRRLKAAHLSLRQIERLTGVAKSTVQNA